MVTLTFDHDIRASLSEGPNAFCVNLVQICLAVVEIFHTQTKKETTRMWANAQPDGRPAKHRGRLLFNATKFGSRPLLDAVQ